MIRFLDFIFSLFALVFLSPVLILLLIFGFIDTGSPLFFQERVGRHGVSFILWKFRTMDRDVNDVESHLVDTLKITNYGSVLRKTKLDELPQLWIVIMGDMSLVGPRPGLPSQFELYNERKKLGVLEVRPGITGLSQLNSIDMSTPKLLAETDAKMLEKMTMRNYIKYIILTVAGNGLGDTAMGKK